MCLPKNIRYLRRKKEWSQEALADFLGYKSYTTIQKWEMGVSEPPIKQLRKMADLFGVDIDDMAKIDLEQNELHKKNDDTIFQAQDQAERDLLVLYRNGDLSEAEKSEVMDLFKSTLDVYYKAKGIKKSE